MLTDAEYLAETGIDPKNLTPEMGEFSWFSLPLPDGTPLWRVKASSAKQKRQIAKAEYEKARLANLAKYINQGYAFDERAK